MSDSKLIKNLKTLMYDLRTDHWFSGAKTVSEAIQRIEKLEADNAVAFDPSTIKHVKRDGTVLFINPNGKLLI